MNLVQFKNKLQALLPQDISEEVVEIVSTMANFIPENDRESVLKSIGKKSTLKSIPSPDIVLTFYSDDIGKAEKIIENLKNNNYYIEKEYNGHYDDWYNDTDDEFNYYDPLNLISDLDHIFSLIHKLYDEEQYEAIIRIGLPILENNVEIKFEDLVWNEEEDLTIGEIIQDMSYLSPSYIQFLKEVVDSSYKLNQFSDSPNDLKKVLQLYSDAFPTLESLIPVLDISSEQLNYVIRDWIDYLSTFPTDENKIYLEEALQLLNDEDYYEFFVIEHINDLPDFFVTFYKDYIDESDRKVHLGKKALDLMNPTLKQRDTVIKELTPHLDKETTEKSELVNLLLESFYSNPTLMNYLNLIVNNEDKNITEKVSTIINNLPLEPNNDILSFLNIPKEENAILHFFNSDFEYLLKNTLSPEYYLGWSRTPIKEILSLFLFLLLEDKDLSPSVEILVDKLANEYFNSGESKNLETNKPYSFKEALNIWKEKNSDPNIDINTTLDKLDKLLEKRVQVIMEKSRTRYYEECALLIAALGEVLESRGIKTKQQYMQKFYDLYPRRRNFVNALKELGFKH